MNEIVESLLKEERQEIIEYLVALRKQRGMSQCDVGSRMGISQGAVTYIERGHNPMVSTLQKYARAVGARLEIRVE